ncbi:phosphotransferase [Streptomyces sp. NPDC058664]|uniref:protein kinase domain-containing protein n=1 Tax=unclassified Streptomyces TaxID=2593676 RepID=UPI00365F8FE4
MLSIRGSPRPTYRPHAPAAHIRTRPSPGRDTARTGRRHRRRLASVHKASVIHRDIKPGNVILSPSGPRLLDFGTVHALDGTSVTCTGMLTGAPG